MRIAIPLAALAASGTKLPGIPRYDYAPLNGDANDYYAAGREVISTPLRQAPLTALLALGVALAVWWALRLRRRRPDLAWAALAGPALALGLAFAAEVRFMHVSGAGTIGWPLVWAVPMAPLRALGALDPDSAFAAGLAVSLAANAVSVVATAYVGRYATGSRAIGLAASGLFALWPLLTGVIAGDSESLLFRPATLLVLAPLALAGVVALRRRRAALFLLGGWIAATASFYSVYESTAQHPRFLLVVLPSLLVLEAAGASAAVRLAGAARRRGNERLRL